jgi:hypothetical protein
MFLDFSNEVEIECSHDRRNHKNDNNLSSLNELLFGVEEAQIKDKDKMGESNSIIEHLAQNDCNHVLIRESKQYKDNDKNINSSSFHLSSEDLTCKKQGEMHYFFSTSSSVTGPKAEYDS